MRGGRNSTYQQVAQCGLCGSVQTCLVSVTYLRRRRAVTARCVSSSACRERREAVSKEVK